MKFAAFIIALITSCIFLFSSCRKDSDSLIPPHEDSVMINNPPQIVTIRTYDSSDYTDSFIVSINYDTFKRLIELYTADPSNTNPYYHLSMRLAFNNDGYLIGVNGYDNDEETTGLLANADVTIPRNENNQIIYISYYNNEYQIRDTTFYAYQTIEGGSLIKTIRKQKGYNDDTLFYKFSNDNRLLSVQQFILSYGAPMDGGKVNYVYDANNSISKIRNEGDSGKFYNEINFYYSSGLPNGDQDLLSRALLGKDYYLPELSSLYPFVFHLDRGVYPNSISATNPNHITRITADHPGLGSEVHEEATLSYEMNEHNNLYKVVFYIEKTLKHPGLSVIRKFRY